MLLVQVRFRTLSIVRRRSCLAHLANVLNISSGFMFTDIETLSEAVVSGSAAVTTVLSWHESQLTYVGKERDYLCNVCYVRFSVRRFTFKYFACFSISGKTKVRLCRLPAVFI